MTPVNGEATRTKMSNYPKLKNDPSSILSDWDEVLTGELGVLPENASLQNLYSSLAQTIRNRIVMHWLHSNEHNRVCNSRSVSYLSAEYLMGPQLGSNLLNLGIEESVQKAAALKGIALQQLLDQEPEPGLGNGGLGRLAACFMDSLATLGIPAVGYGIRYEFGLFEQTIQDGWQVEVTDKWLRIGNPWEMERPEEFVEIKVGGKCIAHTDPEGKYSVTWIPDRTIKGIPYDTPIIGYRNCSAINLRLWKSEAIDAFNLSAFNVGDYFEAVSEKVRSENISKILYPNDQTPSGRQLRLEQQYFFVSCSLQDMIRNHLRNGNDIRDFHQKFAVHMNDTHPSIGVAELMRLLIDEHELNWDEAWKITNHTFAYTNHTLMAEALEKWPVSIFGNLLPRHLEIIYEINHRFLEEIETSHPNDTKLLQRMSIIEEGNDKQVRMALLATVGGHAVNGVSRLHTDLLEEHVLRDFYRRNPGAFHSITNGVTPRRWIALSNPRLASVITQTVGPDWLVNLDLLKGLEPCVDDTSFVDNWLKMRSAVKGDLVNFILHKTGLVVDPTAMFDVQVKRFHEYKRQLLNVLHLVNEYNIRKENPNIDYVPRVFLFGGKASAAYMTAKLIIKLIHSVADMVNNDPDLIGGMKVVFIPDYNVSAGQKVYPASDLAEQISTAGMEASGTGNMKFALNGSLTIGTLDGANIEIRECVGSENFFRFGLTAAEVEHKKSQGYKPWEYLDSCWELKTTLDSIVSGRFSKGDRDLFRPLTDSLLSHDNYMLMADFEDYVNCQRLASEAFRNQKRWARMSILNVARCGTFSSDRAITEYSTKIWNVNATT